MKIINTISANSCDSGYSYKVNNITIAGWVASYLSDIENDLKLTDIDGKILDEDAFSWSLGVRYHFGKQANIFAGFRQTDSDNDYRDENVFSVGMLFKFGPYTFKIIE